MFDSISLFRILKNGFVGASRNLWLAGAATFVNAVTLLILTGLLLVLGVISHSLNEVRSRVDVSIYLKTGTAESQILDLKKELEGQDLVKEVEFISSEKALADFKSKNAGDKELLESLSELSENPLAATLRVRAKSIDQYPKLAEKVTELSGKSIIDKVNFEDNRLLIERMSKILRITTTGGLGFLLAFAALAVMVNFNTVALAIYHRKEEVEIMRLVGATNGYIRGPFLVEAVLYSLLATLITAVVVVPLYLSGLPRLAVAFGLGQDFNGFFTLWTLIPLQFGVAIIISSTASLLAIRKYLRI